MGRAYAEDGAGAEEAAGREACDGRTDAGLLAAPPGRVRLSGPSVGGQTG